MPDRIDSSDLVGPLYEIVPPKKSSRGKKGRNRGDGTRGRKKRDEKKGDEGKEHLVDKRA